MVEVRDLSVDELDRVAEIDVSEEGDVVFVVRGGEIVPTGESWARPRDEDLHVERWVEYLEAGGTALGAFDGHRLVGIAVYRPDIDEEVGQLAALFVDRSLRRSGIARNLLDEVVRRAGVRGDRRLYVSAVPSESAVGFYLAHGFELAEEVHPELFALEPEDVHLIRRL